MQKSMTGYGRATANELGCEFTIEIRAVNHRYLDCQVRTPRLFSFIEDTIKMCVNARLVRGKIDVFVNVDNKSGALVKVSLNKPVVASYLEAMQDMKDSFALAGEPTIQLIAKMPDVFMSEKEEMNHEAVTQTIAGLMTVAIDELEAQRMREGERLCKAILGQIDSIEAILIQIEQRSPKIIAEYRTKLEARMRELLTGVTFEEGRLLAEVALFADKIANDEELVRLRSHLVELKNLLSHSKPQGRKVDFLVQELNREANTIGSKGNDATMAHLVVDLKSEIEKIREQVQNLE